jgi:small conductance mechanosensitive channel
MYRIMGLLDVNNSSEEAKEAISWIEQQIPGLIEFGKKLLIALIIILVGRKLIKWVGKLVDGSFKRARVDESISKFLLSFVKIALNIFVVIMAARVLGLESGSIVALVGSVGLTIGLSLQGSLANFAGGVLILIMKPFILGDYIVTNENEGTVSSIDIFYTKLLTIDNKLVVIPNGTLSNSSIVNLTSEPLRRLDLLISVDYSENIRKVKEILLKLGQAHELVLKDPKAEVFMFSFDPSSIKMSLRLWVESDNYWILKFDLLEQIKEAFDENNIIIPFDQLDVNINRE